MSRKTSIITSSGLGAALMVGAMTSSMFGSGGENFLLAMLFLLIAAPFGDWIVSRSFSDADHRLKLSLAIFFIILGIIYAVLGK